VNCLMRKRFFRAFFEGRRQTSSTAECVDLAEHCI
jgi:hypothetical protein